MDNRQIWDIQITKNINTLLNIPYENVVRLKSDISPKCLSKMYSENKEMQKVAIFSERKFRTDLYIYT